MAGGPESGEITRQLKRWAQGDSGALDVLMPVIYSELRRIAAAYVHSERREHTLQPTALVNEAWLRLARQDHLDFESRRGFFALAAHTMRQVLVDYARMTRAEKRGGGAAAVTLPESLAVDGAGLDQLLALDCALEQLAAASPRQARIIELRYFGGLKVEEVALILNVSPASISREQRSAEAWLNRALSAKRET